MSNVTQYDNYLVTDDVAAIVIREWLSPVEGPDGIFFPPTFAEGGGFEGGYNIDTLQGENNVCLVDSVGSQANRIEPLFAESKYRHLIPQIVIKAGDKEVNLLHAGHRVGDAIVRCSTLQHDARQAFLEFLKGDATRLAKLAPTSLVFGVWDSRDTYAKLPRVIASTIRAFNVRRLRRGAVYTPPVDYPALDIFTEEEKAKAEGDNKSPLAKRGFVHVPSSSHGGVIADGGIRRDATLGFASIRSLFCGKDQEKTIAIRRYILGLSLVALTHRVGGNLRQGCTLVLDQTKQHDFLEVYANGDRKSVTITPEEALGYANVAAEQFGVGESITASFEKERAKADLTDKKAKVKKTTKKEDKPA